MDSNEMILQFVFDARQDVKSVLDSLELIEKEIGKEKVKREERIKLEKKCTQCGGLLSLEQAKHNHPFCSRDCYREWTRINGAWQIQGK